jgi:hypothetical protein
MTRCKTTDRAMTAWAKEVLAALPHRVRVLIALAKWDLYNGPLYREHARDLQDESDGPVEEWPGFSKATDELKEALAEHATDVYVDLQSETASTHAPQDDEYEDANPDYDPDDDESEETITVRNAVDWSDYATVSASDAISYLVGDELAKYVV